MYFYFEGMFSSGMKEATEQKVSLKGFSADTFGMILRIIFESRNIITEAWLAKVIDKASQAVDEVFDTALEFGTWPAT